MRTLHPRRGPRNPITATPPQPPGSLRRTTTIDLLRPDGPDGDVLVDGRGRDLVMSRGSRPRTSDTASLRAHIDYVNGSTLLDIRAVPDDDGLRELLGATVGPGFRSKVVAAIPQAAADRTLAHLLLDDLPGATLVSGYARFPTGKCDMNADPAARRTFLSGRINLCSGFSESGTMLTEMSRTGALPLPYGPVAPPLESPEHPLAWHAIDPLQPNGIRRRRLMDVAEVDERLLVRAMFRDSHRDDHGVETVIHEYDLTAEIDRADLRVLAIEAMPRVLPWVECPHAAASATRLLGQTVHDLRTWVRAQLTGITTCTHLNDLLRSLADIDRLVEEL